MSCDCGHLGFPIGIKNRNLVKDNPMIIHLQFGFSQFISFREEDLWNFSQSEHIIGPGSHIEYPTGSKNSNFVEDHPRNIPAKFGSNRPCGFGEEAWNVKSLQTTDDGRQVMAIVHMDLWSRWNNNTDSHDITEILLKVALNTMTLNLKHHSTKVGLLITGNTEKKENQTKPSIGASHQISAHFGKAVSEKKVFRNRPI